MGATPGSDPRHFACVRVPASCRCLFVVRDRGTLVDRLSPETVLLGRQSPTLPVMCDVVYGVGGGGGSPGRATAPGRLGLRCVRGEVLQGDKRPGPVDGAGRYVALRVTAVHRAISALAGSSARERGWAPGGCVCLRARKLHVDGVLSRKRELTLAPSGCTSTSAALNLRDAV